MRRAMAEAEVGDDVFGEDPTVNKLQKLGADLFGMEAALFVPSGSMSNLIAVMVHCRERGAEIIVGDQSHLHIYEQGSSAQCAGVHSTTVTNLPDGTFDLEEVEAKIRHGYPDAHYPSSRLICVENTHNIQGGRILPLSFLRELRLMADRYGLAVHMDGARLMNAAVALGVQPADILQYCDTVSVCLSKGLGAPVGTLLGGPREYVPGTWGGLTRIKALILDVVKCRTWRWTIKWKITQHSDVLSPAVLCPALLQSDPPLYQVEMSHVETNILRFRLCDPRLTPEEFCERMAAVGSGEAGALGQEVRVLMFPHVGRSVRAVWHLGISREDTQLAIQKLHYVTRQCVEDSQRA
ncbi:THA2 aldolase, partial [Amia calva]|nr:THA2 aldolase [Amia calva]